MKQKACSDKITVVVGSCAATELEMTEVCVRWDLSRQSRRSQTFDRVQQLSGQRDAGFTALLNGAVFHLTGD